MRTFIRQKLPVHAQDGRQAAAGHPREGLCSASHHASSTGRPGAGPAQLGNTWGFPLSPDDRKPKAHGGVAT